MGHASRASEAAIAVTRFGLGAQAGLNENLAREIMELHTVGSGSGYSQGGVTEFARALTGWTVDAARAPRRSSRRRQGDPSGARSGEGDAVLLALSGCSVLVAVDYGWIGSRSPAPRGPSPRPC